MSPWVPAETKKVSTSLLEIAKLLFHPQKIFLQRKDFDLHERLLQAFPVCTAGCNDREANIPRERALQRSHPTHREVSCGDTDID